MTGVTLSLLEEKILSSPFAKVYWFSRYLINGDCYGSLGTLKPEILNKLASELERLLLLPLDDKTIIAASISSTQTFTTEAFKPKTKSAILCQNLSNKLSEELKTRNDIRSLVIAIRLVVLSINDSLKEIPSDDKEFVLTVADSFFRSRGESCLGELISLWDDLGVKSCINVERVKVTLGYETLLENLSKCFSDLSNNDKALIATAYVQEFERRLGQKRKARGGGSLEDLLGFLFKFFSFSACDKPEHFQQDMEVDKWFKCKDGWLVGISCKRTLRERWKQLSGATPEQLSNHKIRELWHVITYDKDLSDDKVVSLGGKRQIFYLADNSEVFKRLSKNVGTKDYVRPLSRLVNDIRMQIC